MGERGDLWHRALIDPSLLRLIGSVRRRAVLEIACGNGHLLRRLARKGAARAVGVDLSPASIRFARAREARRPSGAVFEVADATRLPFDDRSFDLVVANMGLMNFRDASGAIAEAARVLRPGGRFVFSISHPCFDLDDRSVWEVERGFGADGASVETVWRKIRGYRDEGPGRSPWRVSRHEVVWTETHHRTLATYARYLYDAGLAVARLDEPRPRAEMVRSSPQGRYIAEIPLHLVVEAVPRPRVRPASRTSAGSPTGASRRSGSGGRRRGSGSRGRGSKPGS
jgi:SAM-dependent methyltransferase